MYQDSGVAGLRHSDDGTLKSWRPGETRTNWPRSWTIARLELPTNIRTDVKFYGTSNPLTADDVKWSWTGSGARPAPATSGKRTAEPERHPRGRCAPASRSTSRPRTGKGTPVTADRMAIFDQPYHTHHRLQRRSCRTSEGTTRPATPGCGPTPPARAVHISQRQIGQSFESGRTETAGTAPLTTWTSPGSHRQAFRPGSRAATSTSASTA